MSTSAEGNGPGAASPPGALRQHPAFVTTHWSVVLLAGRNDTPRGHEAIARLCEAYWYPLYAYVRRRGHSVEDAQDLTQEFFSRLLAGNWVGDADRARGRFRTFLLTALDRFLANEWRRGRAQKRGGGAACVPLDTAFAESRYCSVAGQSIAPGRFYERQWGLALLDRALARLEAEQQVLGKGAAFAVLSPALTAERGDIPYGKIAEQLGGNEAAARVAVHRLRKRFRELFREEVALTVSPDQVEEEIRQLFAALAD